MAVLGLLIVLIVLVFLIVKPSGEITETIAKNISPTPVKDEKAPKKEWDFESLRKIIKNKKSTPEQLAEALELIIKYHGKIHPRLGVRAHPDFDRYMDILFTICRHRKATSKMIVKFDKELSALNPDYLKEINDAIARGLNSRGA